MKWRVLMSGLLLLAAVWAGPLLGAWRNSFAAHMLAHMGVVAVAAPLLAIGISRTRWNLFGRTETFLLAPVAASLIELIVVWAWHAPALRALSESSMLATVIEQACFLAAGIFLWLSCIGHGKTDAPARSAAGAFGLLLTSIHMTLLGALLALSPRPLYGASEVTCLGLTLDGQQDQELGGVIMLLVGAAAYLAGGVALLGRVLAAGPKKAAG